MTSFPNSPPAPSASQVLSVSQLNRLIRSAIERSLPLSWVSGEISNLTRAASGHVYFTLKDAGAQVRCVMWRSRAQLSSLTLRNGLQVEARVLATLYEPRGDFQLTVENLRLAGSGDLFATFMRLKEQLTAEGLFDPSRKQLLPRLPRALGIVTSLQAAALRDVLITLARRAPSLPIILFPTLVQGDGSSEQIAQAIEYANRMAEQQAIDALLVVRGGGSMEDLWAFNDEALIRRMATSHLPVITGIGHETDFTLADFVADLRAPTPTAAAELVSQGIVDISQQLTGLKQRLRYTIQRQLNQASQRLDYTRYRLRHPREKLHSHQQTLAWLSQRLRHAHDKQETQRQRGLQQLQHRLAAVRPQPAQQRPALERLEQRLQHSLRQKLSALQQQIALHQQSLTLLNPEHVLERGYAVVRNGDGQIIRDAQQLSTGEEIQVQLHRGSRHAQIL